MGTHSGACNKIPCASELELISMFYQLATLSTMLPS